ncbi:MAG: TolC family protein [Saprospiraceae bacterium]|nr:TolC family protein [Saprospiraceae bacterium]
MQDLNFIMGESLENTPTFSRVQESFLIPVLEEVNRAIENNNPELKLSQLGIVIASSSLQLNKLDNRPQVTAFANLGYNYQRNDVQQLAQIHTAGLSIGLNARYTLFDDGVRKNRISNATVELEIHQSRKQLLEVDLKNQALQAHNTLTQLQAQLKREQENLGVFEEAYTKTQDQFYAGKVNNLALRDAQLAKLDVQTRISRLELDIVKSQLRLKALMGTLIEN